MTTTAARRTERPETAAAPSAPKLLTGAGAVVEAMRQIEPDVVPVYPITPQTPMIEGFAKLVANGRAGAEIMNVESEHSAMSAAVGAALAGARTITASSSQGLALMAEVVYLAVALRAPIVMAIGNRALSGPINIHCDHSDSMLIRDSGVVQLFAESAQEVYDLMLMAPRIAEHEEVLLPVLVCQDGFTLTHSAEGVVVLDDATARSFVGEYRVPNPLLDTGRVTSQGALAMPDYYFEQKYQQVRANEAALGVLEQLAAEFAVLSGRAFTAVEPYALEDAERALVVLGSTAGTVKEVVDAMRAEGERVGLLRIGAFRPFPSGAVRRALAGVSSAVVLDRAVSPGAHPPLLGEIAACLYNSDAELHSCVYGLGGRDLDPSGVRSAFARCGRTANLSEIHYLGLRR
jgi:pyruvate ferredoxin oxidoreductase alpha subunit